MSKSDLERYVTKHLTSVAGWAGTPESLLLHADLLGLQEGCDAFGSFEIGVHHGRYLIALHNACAMDTPSLGIDLFDDQAANVDGSGSGHRASARANIDRYARQPELVELIDHDSLTVSPGLAAEWRNQHGPFRIVSVDGGHTPTHAASDIRLASSLCAAGGFISVDDFFHPNFPGVTEGVYATLDGNQTPFVPWLATRKKLFLAHISYKDRYLHTVRERLADQPLKAIQIAGHDCLSLYV